MMTSEISAADLYRAGASFRAIRDALVAQGAEPEQALQDAVDGVLAVWNEWMGGENGGDDERETDSHRKRKPIRIE